LGLFLLIPKSEKLGLFCSGEAKLSKGDWARILVLFGTMALTGVFALYYEAISNRRSFAEFVDLLRRAEESTLAQRERFLSFCSLIPDTMVWSTS